MPSMSSKPSVPPAPSKLLMRSMGNNKVLTVLAALACASTLAVLLAGCSSGGGSADSDHGITVSASSETKVVPDKARISISVISEGKEAAGCQSDNAESVNAVIEALGALDVDETSIQTSYSDLSPRYGSRTTDTAAGSDDDAEDDVAYDEWVITGYEMTTTLSISDLDIENVGTVIQACVDAGANQTDGIEYYASTYDEAYNEALANALETAKVKAEGIAGSAGVGLGKVINVTEGYQDTSARYTTASDMEELQYAAADSAIAAKAMPGQVNIEANVTVTFAIS